MPFLFIDYTNLVLNAYDEKREANQLSRLLMHPTTANIRQECLNVYNERIKKGEVEEDILRAFFGVPPAGRNFDYIIDRHHADKFRPLQSFIKREIRNPALVTVELLAWLIDFTPRPLAFAQRMFGNWDGTTVPPVPLKIEIDSITELGQALPNETGVEKVHSTIHAENTENLLEDGENNKSIKVNDDTVNPSLKSSWSNVQKRKLKIVVATFFVCGVLLGGIYIIGKNNDQGKNFSGDKKTSTLAAEDSIPKQKADSLIPGKNNNATASTQMNKKTIHFPTIILDSSRCLGITKKGAQCKRKPKENSDYCWQHGG